MTNCLTSLESFSKIFEIFDAQIILSHFVITRYIFCDVYIYVHTKMRAYTHTHTHTRIYETFFYSVPIVLVGNKTDLYVDRMITTDQGKRLASSWNAAFLETSAKQNEVSTNTFAIVPC